MGIQVNRKKMAGLESIKDLRSYYSLRNKTLYVNKGLSFAQEKFLLGREIAFQYMNITHRPYETIIQHSDSFEMLLNNFKASYFSVALLMPEENFVEDGRRIVQQPRGNDKSWLERCAEYDITHARRSQRLT